MHSLCIDTYGNLRLKYEKNEDSQAEMAIQDWLNEAGYEKDGNEYVIPRDKSSKFRDVIKWTVKKFGDKIDLLLTFYN